MNHRNEVHGCIGYEGEKAGQRPGEITRSVGREQGEIGLRNSDIMCIASFSKRYPDPENGIRLPPPSLGI